MLSGTIEADETYIGGNAKQDKKFDNKMAVMGIVEKKKGGGRVKAIAAKQADATIALPFLRVRSGVHTHTIEGFWGQLKRSLGGTYHCVSPKYLQLYVNEFVYRYNHRLESVFPALMESAVKRVQ